MELFSIPNLSATQVSKLKPWELDFDLPEFKNSNDYKSWCTRPSTRYNAYSTAEGVDPNQRVSSQNPAQYLHESVLIGMPPLQTINLKRLFAD